MNDKLKAIKYFIYDAVDRVELVWWMIMFYSFILSVCVWAIMSSFIALDSGAYFLISMIVFFAFNYIFNKYPKFGAIFGYLASIFLSLLISKAIYNAYGIFWAISVFIITVLIFLGINFASNESE